MTEPRTAAVEALAALLEQENAALARLDLPAVVALLPAKQQAAARFADLPQVGPGADTSRRHAPANPGRGQPAPAGTGHRGAGRGDRRDRRRPAEGRRPAALRRGGAPVRNGPTVAFALSARV